MTPHLPFHESVHTEFHCLPVRHRHKCVEYLKVFFEAFANPTTQFDDEAVGDLERLHLAFLKYPWKGGYSAVNFYNDLYQALPPSAKPKVAGIRYNSHG